jgi:hypothetical protein
LHCSRPPNFRTVANMTAGKSGPPDSSNAPPTPLEARSVHTTRIVESHLTWVAKLAKFALSGGESTPRYRCGCGRAAFPPIFHQSKPFFCSLSEIISYPRLSAFAVLSEPVSFPNKKNATSQSSAHHCVRSLQRCLAHHSQCVDLNPCPRPDTIAMVTRATSALLFDERLR